MKWTIGLVAQTVVCVASVVASFAVETSKAGDVQMVPVVGARFDPITMAPLPLVFDPTTGRVANGQPGIFRIDMAFTAQTGPGERGWYDSEYGFFPRNLSGGSRLSTLPGSWNPNLRALDVNGAEPGGVFAVYVTNGDQGGDLRHIIT